MNSSLKIKIAGIAFLICITGCTKTDSHTFREFHMGTYADITIRQDEVSLPYVKKGVSAAFRAIERIDYLMSSYREDSAISRLNRTPKETTVELDPDVFVVFREAVTLYSMTKGAFDITIGQLAEKWGFYSQDIIDTLPSTEEIEIALKVVGTKYLVLRPGTTSAYLEKDGMKIDVAGLAKGYAVDKAVQALKRHGVHNAIVNCGGDIYCLGKKSDKEVWNIGIRHPRKADTLIGLLHLSDTAVATSGDYENFVTFGGDRYSHIIDPRTGKPSLSEVIGVTVLAPQCLTADGLATALFVMGAIEGIKLVEALPQVECIIVSEKTDSDDLLISVSSGLGSRATIFE